ncbi:GGDEF domain-containing protein [Roseibium sp. SCPC15]|uniref:GGDEF domain-containing protein n=1 Tax=Roseibium sp. SCP15 TaxID=3141376 RepID=UPI00333ABB92
MGLAGLKPKYRNPLLLALASASALVFLFTVAFDALIDWQAQVALRKSAEIRAQSWASNFLKTTPSARRMVEKGIATPSEINRFKDSFALVGVIRFVMFNKDGMQTLLSDSGVLEPTKLFNAKALGVIETGQSAVFFHDHDDEEASAETVDTYVEVYLPADLPSGERIGALEVYVDVSDFEEALEESFQWMSGYLIVGTIAVLLLPALAYVRRTRQLMRKDKQLLELTRYDHLTGVLNRESVSKFLDEHFANETENGNLGILFVDVDHFKQVNDQFGHACGDKLLKHVADILRSSTRNESDIVGRFGGDEFVIMFPNTTPGELRRLYRHVMEAANEPCRRENTDYVPSLSVGAYVTSGADTRQSALHRADLAVYAAKRQGRNRVVEYSEDLESLFSQKETKVPA